MTGRDPVECRIVSQIILVKRDLFVFASQPAEAIFLRIADRQQVTRRFADAINVVALAGLLRPQATLGRRVDRSGGASGPSALKPITTNLFA